MQTGAVGAGGAGGTPPPWLSPWLHAVPSFEVRRRTPQRDRAPYRGHVQPAAPGPAAGLTFYAYGPYGRDPQPIFRIGGFPDVSGARAGAGAGGSGAVPGTGWERYPLHQFEPLFAHSSGLSRLPAHVNLEWVVPSPAPPRALPDAHRLPLGGVSGRAVLRAWLLGSALLVLALVLVRAIDKCLHLNWLHSRRRSQEWPTPSVRATSRQATDNSIVIIPEEEVTMCDPPPAAYGEAMSVDLPPPYSECLRDERVPDPGGPEPQYAEPPPGYDDSCVHFSNKLCAPAVHLHCTPTPALARRPLATSDDGQPASEQSTPHTRVDIHELAQNNACVLHQRETVINNTELSDRAVSSARVDVHTNVAADLDHTMVGISEEENQIREGINGTSNTEERNGEIIIMV